ncbi:LapD/MoxY N-terminal periplasmic domain-containing protein [Bordetella sp. N]|uniref:bifunctional diguanylate cyclase/phosphodiesterase n=1 Tax=Bordetella sp. N TaxID=1746199 RepID=UPI00070D1BE6|nr:LapD/MoxY N-terminal periplasmic domain-containing protein [Bordetella sp. N]ALM83288.1 diguanylate phosphodiesterase [Bordetella sp. N]
MSILRQLLLSITLAIAIILLGTLALSVTAARDYLAGQLQVQSNDAAVSLALSLSQPTNSDRITQELLLSALYDGGHFSLVKLTDPDGKVIISRVSSATADVPGWFQRLVPLSAKSATHVVTDGWRQLGSVTLTATDVYAWETLWESSLRMILLVVTAGVLWALFAFALVRWIQKRLLGEVGEQLRAIGRGQWGQHLEPRVPELSGITDALNQTREQLRASADEQNARIESLQIEVNQDPVTGLANRKYFINEFRRELDADSARTVPDAAMPGGHILVFRQRDLGAINRHMPRDFVDQWLRTLVDRLRAMLENMQVDPSVLARLNGSDFALLLPHCPAPKAIMVAERLRAELRTARIPVGEGGLCRWVQALADYAPGAQIGDLLGRLDYALMRGESAGDDHVQLTSDDEPVLSANSESSWRQVITAGIERERFTLALQPLTFIDGQLLRQEATLMLHSEDASEPIPARLFIPPAIRLDLAADCDMQAVRLALDWLAKNPGELTVRLSMASLGHHDFLARLERTVSERLGQANRLIAEVDAHALVERHAEAAALCRIATKTGMRVGVRRLAQQFNALSQLHDLQLAYVKLGGGFVGGMAHSIGSQQLTVSVLETARALNIAVYAEDVPDTVTRTILANLGITIMSGAGVNL